MLETEVILWKKDAGLQVPVMLKYNYDTKTLTIYTTSPGWFIGTGGMLYERYHGIISKRMGYDVKIEFVETWYVV